MERCESAVVGNALANEYGCRDIDHRPKQVGGGERLQHRPRAPWQRLIIGCGAGHELHKRDGAEHGQQRVVARAYRRPPRPVTLTCRKPNTGEPNAAHTSRLSHLESGELVDEH